MIAEEDCGRGLRKISQPVTHVPEHLCHMYDQYVAAGLRADSAVRNAYPLFTGKNDPKMSDICP